MNPYSINALVRRHQAAREETKLKPAELMSEISWSESDIYKSFYAYGQNPDPIARQKGLKIYRDMMEDDQVKACIELRKQARLSTPWNIVSAKQGDAQADMLADFVRHVIKRLNGTFEDNLYEIYSAIEFGFSLSELVYEMMETGPFSGKIGLRAIKTREPFNYDFKTDEFGNLLGIVYTGIAPSSQVLTRENLFRPINAGGSPSPRNITNQADYFGSFENPMPPEKFVIYSYNSQFGNFYGRSDLYSAFRSWIHKKHVMKFWAIWLERYASPFIWAQVKEGHALSPAMLREIDDFIKNLSAKSGLRVPGSVTLNPIQFSTAGGDAYEKAIESHNRFISHAILCPNLIGITGSQGSGGSGGSYALGKKHFDAFVWVLEKMGRDTSETIVGEQIIKRLVDLNFPEVDSDMMPRFKFEGLEEDSIETRSRIVTMLSASGFINPEESWIRDFLAIPKLEAGIELPDPMKDINSDEEDEDEDEDFNKKESKKKIYQAKDREATAFEKKVRVREFARKLDSAEIQFQASLTVILEDSKNELIASVERKNIIENADPKEVETIKFNVGELKKMIASWLVKMHLDSKLQTLEEIGRAGVEVEITRKFQEIDAPFEPWKPLPPQEAVDFFNRKVLAKIANRAGKKVLLELASRNELRYYDEKAFSIAGIIRDDILNDAKQVLLNGIKRQDRPGAIKDLKQVFDKYLESGVEVDEELLRPHRLQTIVRTNISEAVNNGRKDMYEDPDVAGFVEYWEYSAILDDRTTDYCQCMDRKIFRMEDLPLLNPPAHFNCRSFSVPITKFEIDDLKTEGRGVEISEACPDRAVGFSDLKTPTIDIPGLGEIEIVERNSPTPEMSSREERLRETLNAFIVRCPYKHCQSDEIELVKIIFNVGEFSCGKCSLPFRVSNAGDIYLYDSGIEKWERVSEGLRPNFFQKMDPNGGAVRCPYKFCQSSNIKRRKKENNLLRYECGDCAMPFKISELGDMYLYDAGIGQWHKLKAGG